jgi:DNA invertase Pin-like site-specific DNA recombinase
MSSSRRTKQSDLTTAIAYLRASKDEQRLSVSAQRASVEEWAKRESVQIVKWFTDQGVCSVTPIEERPALCAALAALREHKAGTLIVAKRDRIARDVVLTAMVERTAAKNGAVVTSAAGEGNGSTPADGFMRTVIDGAAAYERALIRARTKAALAAKKAKGERTGGIPYGFELAPDGRTLVPSENERRIIQRVKAIRAKGVPIRKLPEACAKAGIVSRAGRPFHKSAIERLLQWRAA